MLEEVHIARTTSSAALRPPGPASTIYRLDVLARSRVSLVTEPTDNTTLGTVTTREVAAISA